VHGHVLRSHVLYQYCNSFLIRDVHGEFGLINAYLFDILLAFSSRKVGDFFVWRVVTPNAVDLSKNRLDD